jgi:hypothetical protein
MRAQRRWHIQHKRTYSQYVSIENSKRSYDIPARIVFNTLLIRKSYFFSVSFTIFWYLLMETDHTLLDSARKMDKDALVKIFDLYSSGLYKYALRLSNHLVMADHIVGDVFAKLLDQLAAGNGPKDHLRSYLYEMTYHQMIDEARHSRRRVSLLLSHPPSVEFTTRPTLKKMIVLVSRAGIYCLVIVTEILHRR